MGTDRLTEEDRARRGRDLFDHLCLDSDPLALRTSAERSELRPRPRPGVLSLLSVVTLRQAAVGADALATSQGAGRRNNWTFLLGRSFLPVVNALLLGSLLYRSRLVPRIIPLVGLIGAPLLLVPDLGVLFGLWPQVSALTAIGALPIALWEFSLGVWLVVKGFKPSLITDRRVPAGLPQEDDHGSIRGGSRPEISPE
jgi:hypothetical protein